MIAASPRPSPVTIAAAYAAGADMLLCVGGAHAIAALAPRARAQPVDLICGPGNKWVTAAKSIVSGFCGIDMLAGPSEVLVITDGGADPQVIASDLLAQAEHDVEARPILVTPDAAFIEKVNSAVQAQLATLTTSAVAIPAVEKGFAVLVADIDEAVKVSDRIAPEHLEIQTADAQVAAAAAPPQPRVAPTAAASPAPRHHRPPARRRAGGRHAVRQLRRALHRRARGGCWATTARGPTTCCRRRAPASTRAASRCTPSCASARGCASTTPRRRSSRSSSVELAR